jgi:hypothetical protein
VLCQNDSLSNKKNQRSHLLKMRARFFAGGNDLDELLRVRRLGDI